MTLDDRIRNHLHAAPAPGDHTDVALIRRAGIRRRRRNQLGAAVAGGALALGGVFGVAQLVGPGGGSEVDLAAEAGGADDLAGLGVEAVPGAAPQSSGSDAQLTAQDGSFAVPRDSIVGTEQGFVALRIGPEGVVVRRSDDGVEWEESPTTGLPASSELFNIRLQRNEGTYVALLEGWSNAPDSREQTFTIATSTGLDDWESVAVEIGAPVTEGFASGLAVRDGAVVALVTAFPDTPDPIEVLFELGVISDEDLERLCGWDDSGPGNPIAIVSCGFGGVLEEDSVLDDDTVEPPQDILVELNPGDPGYDEFRDALSASESARRRMFSIGGPIGGPYETTEIDLALEFVDSVLATSTGYLATGFSDTGRSLLESVDGLDWRSVGGGLDSLGESAIEAHDDLLFAAVSRPDGVEILRSLDNGRTWTSTLAPHSAAIDGGWAELRSGPAGIAILVSGTSESLREGEARPGEEPSAEFPGLVYALLFSSDDGETWRELSLPVDVAASGGGASLVAVGDDEVLLQVFPAVEVAVAETPDGSRSPSYVRIRTA